MFDHIERLESPTGATLAFRHLAARNAPRAILMICHGMSEHSGRYATFAEAMSSHGFHVYAHDHRGHGLTAAADTPRGRFAARGGADKVIADVVAMRDHTAGNHPGLPVVLFGHSMGGLISLNTALAHPEKFAAAAVWNINALPGRAAIAAARLLLKAERALKGSDVPGDILPRLTVRAWNLAIGENRTEADWLSHDRAAVDAFLADPLTRVQPSVSLWLDLFDLMARWPVLTKTGGAHALPFHLLGGGEDPSTNYGKDVARLAACLKKAGFRSVELSIYPHMRHETLNDTGAEEAVAAFAAWCDARLAEME